MADTHDHGPPPPPEPKTPMWLPAVGAVLFLTAGLIWGLPGSNEPKSGSSGAPAASAAPAAADAGAAKPRTR
jgi:hypothetical protein